MPWRVVESSECPASKPWACIRETDGTIEGCHETEEAAQAQMRALYANEPQGASTGMEHKTFELIETKADDDEAGTFSALASVFGNVDRVGDRMLKGSFTKTLAKWRESGKPIPVILSHDWNDPHKYVGKADPRAVFETDEGLMVQGRIDTSDSLGRKVYQLMKDRILTGWSFGYSVPKGGQKRNGKVNEIREVELFEVGPTLVGANPAAQLQDIKSVFEAEEETSSQVEEETPPTEAIEPESDGANEEPQVAKSRPNALKERSLAASLEVLGEGARQKQASPPQEDPELEYWELKKRSREAVVDVLKGA